MLFSRNYPKYIYHRLSLKRKNKRIDASHLLFQEYRKSLETFLFGCHPSGTIAAVGQLSV